VEGGKMFETGLIDGNYNDIKLRDKVNLFGMRGMICFEAGAFGICFPGGVDYDLIQSKMDEDDWCCGNKYHGCFNDNFLSLWELYWNFNSDEGCIEVLKITGK
jgi:hypothetical protein